jgi:nicotinate phosphoribosyltransferase
MDSMISKKDEPIIKSLLDNDLYKFSMAQAVLHHFPGVEVAYRFRCREEDVLFTESMRKRIKESISHLCTLSFTPEEVNYIRQLYYIKPDYADLLEIFRLQEKYVSVADEGPNGLGIVIMGPWLHTILFEVPILAIVNEVYFAETGQDIASRREAHARLTRKTMLARSYGEGFKFSDFGTRRRFSGAWHDELVGILAEKLPSSCFVGTSNVMLARKYGIRALGTMAHEWIQAGQALTRVRESQKFMLQKWADEYRGHLGTALSDTLGIDAFLRDFDAYFAKLFDGVRHDSGSPRAFAEKVIGHYISLGINPKTKTAIFSDGLTMEKAGDLYREFQDRMGISFGIGTSLTNDVGCDPLNIVVKMVMCNGQPVAKISDSSGKGMCEDSGYLAYLKEQFGL